MYPRYPEINEDDKRLAKDIFFGFLWENFFAEMTPVNIPHAIPIKTSGASYTKWPSGLTLGSILSVWTRNYHYIL